MPLNAEGSSTWPISMKRYDKYFKHQCIALIRLARYFLAHIESHPSYGQGEFTLDQLAERYNRLHIFMRASDRALEVIRGLSGFNQLDKGKKALKEAKDALEVYVHATRIYVVKNSDGEDDSPLGMMNVAEQKDEKRGKQITTLDSIKKAVPGNHRKFEVKFCVHEGGGQRLLDFSQRLCEHDTIEEVIFKFNRANPRMRIRITDGASFYAPSRLKCQTIEALGLRKPGGQYTSLKAVNSSALQYYLQNNIPDRRIVHVLVDRNPRVQVLLGGNNWARLFSLSSFHSADPKTLVMKDISGELHRSQEIIQRFIGEQAATGSCKIYQLDWEMKRVPVDTIIDSTDESWLTRLQDLHSQIIKLSTCQKSDKILNRQWLLQLPQMPLPASFDGRVPKEPGQGPPSTFGPNVAIPPTAPSVHIPFSPSVSRDPSAAPVPHTGLLDQETTPSTAPQPVHLTTSAQAPESDGDLRRPDLFPIARISGDVGDAGEGPETISPTSPDSSGDLRGTPEPESHVPAVENMTIFAEQSRLSGIDHNESTFVESSVAQTDEDMVSIATDSNSRSKSGSINIHEPRARGTDSTIITHEMSITEIIAHLGQHGCLDVTAQIDISRTSECLVTGGFGNVYRGALRDGSLISLKCLRTRIDSTENEKKRLKRTARELYVWSKCKHPNVLTLIGVAQHQNQIAMVSPWMENGNLRSFLSKQPHVDRRALCAQIASGVAYLHNEGIAHGDIKGDNILFSQDSTPKLADFGSATLGEYTLQFTRTTSIAGMSLNWAAPEVIEEETGPTIEADVYSLGMTILEVLTGKIPYAGARPPHIIGKIMKGVHPTRPEEHIPSQNKQADILWSLLTSCWAYAPQDRPTAIEVRVKMESVASGGKPEL